MNLVNLDTGELLPKGAKVSYKISPKDMTSEQLQEYLDCSNYKLSFTIDYDNWSKINNNIKVSEILVDDKGATDFKVLGFFATLCEYVRNGYKGELKFQYEKDLIEITGLSKSTYNRYMKKLKDTDLIRITEYRNCKCLVINPIYMRKGFCLSAPTFLAYKDIIKQYLDPYIYEYYRRIYEECNVIILKNYKARYVDI